MKAARTRARTGRRELSGRLDEAYLLLTAGRHTTAGLARALGVSVPTAFRVIERLRRRGTKIESVKRGREWYFEVLEDEALEAAWKSDPLLRKIGFIRGARRKPGESEDDVLYGRG